MTAAMVTDFMEDNRHPSPAVPLGINDLLLDRRDRISVTRGVAVRNRKGIGRRRRFCESARGTRATGEQTTLRPRAVVAAAPHYFFSA